MRLLEGAALAALIFANSGSIVFGQEDSVYRLPAGTRITVKMDAEINSGISSVNDTFLAFVAKPVKVRGAVVVPEDTVVEGRVTHVISANGGGDGGSLDVVFETIRFGAVERTIDGVIKRPLNGESKRTFGVISVLGGVAAGALVGSARSGRGALIGAGIGAGIGSAVALAKKGEESRLKRGEEFEIELRRELVVPVIDY